jgi:hypothetical protein
MKEPANKISKKPRGRQGKENCAQAFGVKNKNVLSVMQG